MIRLFQMYNQCAVFLAVDNGSGQPGSIWSEPDGSATARLPTTDDARPDGWDGLHAAAAPSHGRRPPGTARWRGPHGARTATDDVTSQGTQLRVTGDAGTGTGPGYSQQDAGDLPALQEYAGTMWWCYKAIFSVIFSAVLTINAPLLTCDGEVWDVICEFNDRSVFELHHCNVVFNIVLYSRCSNGTWLYCLRYVKIIVRPYCTNKKWYERKYCSFDSNIFLSTPEKSMEFKLDMLPLIKQHIL